MGRSKSPAEAPTPRHYVVLVLGDVGRSPRMQYHTVSLADLPGTCCRTVCLSACDQMLRVLALLRRELQVPPCH